MKIRVTMRWHRQHGADLAALIELLGVAPVCLRYSSYQGIELVLEWAPAYRCITVVGLGRSQVYLYSKFPFRGATQASDVWELTL